MNLCFLHFQYKILNKYWRISEQRANYMCTLLRQFTNCNKPYNTHPPLSLSSMLFRKKTLFTFWYLSLSLIHIQPTLLWLERTLALLIFKRFDILHKNCSLLLLFSKIRESIWCKAKPLSRSISFSLKFAVICLLK